MYPALIGLAYCLMLYFLWSDYTFVSQPMVTLCALWVMIHHAMMALHLWSVAWAQFCCEMWGDSLVWNQAVIGSMQKWRFIQQIPNLIS